MRIHGKNKSTLLFENWSVVFEFSNRMRDRERPSSVGSNLFKIVEFYVAFSNHKFIALPGGSFESLSFKEMIQSFLN